MKYLFPVAKIAATILITSFILIFFGCKKFLDKKPDQKLAVPTTLSDLELLLNSYETLNCWYPVIGQVASDDYYVTDASFNSLTERDRKFYLWEKCDDVRADWSLTYRAIFTSNIMLETLNTISSSDKDRAAFVKGNALFIRAFHHFMLAQLFCRPYDRSSSVKDEGIPLRLQSDISLLPTRASVEDTYTSILSDLHQAVRLLPHEVAVKYHAGQAAAYGLLSRVYLSMRKYEQAGLYADSALQISNTLMDYNELNAGATIPFSRFNNEVIYGAESFNSPVLIQSRANVDTNLYASYAGNDLRKQIYFRTLPDGSHSFKGNYTGSNAAPLFVGIATDELILNRAECAARQDHLQIALDDLNTLLTKRYQSGTFVPLSSTDKVEVLGWVMKERRKELLFRTLRWSDLRRLNLEQGHEQEIYRIIDNHRYTLLPNSDRYVFQIDVNSVNESGLNQNP